MKKPVHLAFVALASAAILPAFAADHPAPVLRLQEVTLGHLLDPVHDKDGARQVNTTGRPATPHAGEAVRHENDARQNGGFKVVPLKAR